MDLNKLRTFTVVAECENISKAANKLHRTQPAISTQLKDLEEELKLILFERKNSRIYLTKEGEILYENAKERIKELDELAVLLRNDSENLEGTICLGVQWELCAYLVPDIVHDFRELYPQVNFEIKPHDHFPLERALLNNEVDMALTILYKQRNFFEIHPYLTVERSMMAASSYLQRIPKVTSFEDVMTLDIIGFNPRLADIKYWLEKNGQAHLIKAIDKTICPVIVKDIDTAHELIKKGVGVGFGDSFMLSDALESGDVQHVLPAAEPMYLTIDISRRKVRTTNLLHDTFYSFMIERAKSRV